MKNTSPLATVTANPVIQSLAAGIAAIASTGSTAVGLSAVISQALFSSASGTAITQNIEKCLEETAKELDDLKEEVANLSANQILVAHQAIREMFVSIDQKRLDILKRIAIGVVKDGDLDEDLSYIIARVLRDVTPGEVEFLKKYFKYPQIYLLKSTYGENPNPDTISTIKGIRKKLWV